VTPGQVNVGADVRCTIVGGKVKEGKKKKKGCGYVVDFGIIANNMQNFQVGSGKTKK
jgi:hypothetical protein